MIFKKDGSSRKGKSAINIWADPPDPLPSSIGLFLEKDDNKTCCWAGLDQQLNQCPYINPLPGTMCSRAIFPVTPTFSWMPTGSTTARLGAYGSVPVALPSHFTARFARSSGSFTRCSSWSPVFWPSRGKPLFCGAGSLRYGPIWPQPACGQRCSPATDIFSDNVDKYDVFMVYNMLN